jgi:hypothetical protein
MHRSFVGSPPLSRMTPLPQDDNPCVRASLFSLLGLAMFAGVWQAGGMKKQGSDQALHDRRYQERKRAEAERKAAKKKVAKQGEESRVARTE